MDHDFFNPDVELKAAEVRDEPLLLGDESGDLAPRNVVVRACTNAVLVVGFAVGLMSAPSDVSRPRVTPQAVGAFGESTRPAARAAAQDHGRVYARAQAIEKVAERIVRLKKLDSVDHLL